MQDDPIAPDDSCRRRSRLPAPRHWLMLFAFGVIAVWNASLLPGGREAAVVLATAVLFLQPLLASLQTSRALLAEREGPTPEAPASSRVEPRTTVDGRAAAAWGPRLLETLVFLAATVALLGWRDAREVLVLGLAYLPDSPIWIVLGSYLGLAVAGRSKSLRGTVVLLVLSWIGLGIALTATRGLLGAAMMAVMHPGMGSAIFFVFVGANVAITAVATLWLRWLAPP